MLQHIFLKFSLFFLAGAVFTIAVTYVFVPNETQKLVKIGNGEGLVLSTSAVQTDGLKSTVQNILEDVVVQISKSPALSPLFETKKSVETAVFEVQSLPDAQRKAVCQEICPTK